jgi:hypothetical protein
VENPPDDLIHSHQSGYVSLKVYDLCGKEVATLVEGMQTAGQHKASFTLDRQSSTGTYF